MTERFGSDGSSLTDQGPDDSVDWRDEERCIQLKKLSREHHECIAFAERIARIAKEGTDADLIEGIELVREYNDRELEVHLQHEEQTIFGPLVQHHREHLQLCIALGKEHGFIRTLVEGMRPETARQDLGDFARVLVAHTIQEERQLFPLLESLLTDEQLAEVMNFVPLRHEQIPAVEPSSEAAQTAPAGREWLAAIAGFYADAGKEGSSIVLFPRYQPESSALLAKHLGLGFIDFQAEVMAEFGQAADSIGLDRLDAALRARSTEGGIVCHNAEALLCVKSEAERRAWLQSFLDTDWPNPIMLPIAIYQAEVPEDHERVCDLELARMPQQSAPAQPGERLKYDI